MRHPALLALFRSGAHSCRHARGAAYAMRWRATGVRPPAMEREPAGAMRRAALRAARASPRQPPSNPETPRRWCADPAPTGTPGPTARQRSAVPPRPSTCVTLNRGTLREGGVQNAQARRSLRARAPARLSRLDRPRPRRAPRVPRRGGRQRSHLREHDVAVFGT